LRCCQLIAKIRSQDACMFANLWFCRANSIHGCRAPGCCIGSCSITQAGPLCMTALLLARQAGRAQRRAPGCECLVSTCNRASCLACMVGCVEAHILVVDKGIAGCDKIYSTHVTTMHVAAFWGTAAPCTCPVRTCLGKGPWCGCGAINLAASWGTQHTYNLTRLAMERRVCQGGLRVRRGGRAARPRWCRAHGSAARRWPCTALSTRPPTGLSRRGPAAALLSCGCSADCAS